MSEKDRMSAPRREPDLQIDFDAASGRLAPRGKGDRSLRVWLRVLNGEDDLAIQEAMITMDERGQGRMNLTGGEVPKFCRSVEWCEGYDFADGNGPGLVDKTRYMAMPRWAIMKIRAKINELDALGTEAAIDSE